MLRAVVWRHLKRHLRPGVTGARGLASIPKTAFSCTECGHRHSKWQGQCDNCHGWNLLQEVSTLPRRGGGKPASRDWIKQSHSKPIRLNDVSMSQNVQRIKLADAEINWVLGGGIVPGSLTLIAGPPGVGKSTLALQIAHMMANASQDSNGAVLYVSGEESVGQVKMRSDRLNHESPNLYLASETNIENIVSMIQTWDKSSPCAGVMVDSIQTMYSAEINSTAGNVSQVKECTLQLLRVCKEENIPMLIIGHITKSGDIAGPKVLEHIVDTVIQLDGEAHSPNRFLRCTKNRFGTTSEVGVLSMTDAGLVPLQNPLQAFLSPSSGPVEGVAVTIAVEGTRPIPVEIQTLSSDAFEDNRTTCKCHGVSYDKLQLIFAVLATRASVSFRSKNAFVNIAQGYFLDEPCADLALAVALASSATKRPVIPNAVFFGELALSGMLRPAVMLEPRLAAASKIGVATCIIPRVTCVEGKKAVDKYSSVIEIRQVDTLVDALALGLIK